MSQIFLPLRSNAGWFANAHTLSALETRLKNHLLLYDEVVLQDGRYRVNVRETGSADQMIPAEHVACDRSRITYFEPGTGFSILVGDTPEDVTRPMLRGTSVSCYEVDFYPILQAAGLLTVDYVRRLDIDLLAEHKNRALKEAQTDSSNPAFLADLPVAKFERTKLLESLYIDARMAQGVNLNFGVDSRIANIIRRNNARASRQFHEDPRDRVLNAWITIGRPDLGDEPWEQVLRTRESAAGRDFRRMIDEISVELAGLVAGDASPDELEAAATRRLDKDLIRELQRNRTSPATAVLLLALNFVPFVAPVVGTAVSTVIGVGSSAYTIHTLWARRRRWISLLRPDSK